MNNLADDPTYAEKVQSLFADLAALQQKMDDSLELKPVYAAIK